MLLQITGIDNYRSQFMRNMIHRKGVVNNPKLTLSDPVYSRAHICDAECFTYLVTSLLYLP